MVEETNAQEEPSSRSARCQKEVNKRGADDTVTSKRVVVKQKADKCMPEDINNNAKPLECADQAIVGSSKSLIQAIKKRRVSEVSCPERISEEDNDTVNVNLTPEEEGEYCDNPFDDDWADDEEISEDSEAETIKDEEVHLNLSMQDTGRMNNLST